MLVHDLTWTERPGRELIRLAWPITVSMVSFSTMTLASTAFVAQVGAQHENALALDAGRHSGRPVEAAFGEQLLQRFAFRGCGVRGVHQRAHHVFVDVLHDVEQFLVNRVAHFGSSDMRSRLPRRQRLH